VKAAVDLAVKAFGRLDCIFNNAGTPGVLENAETVTAEGFDAVMRLHVLGAMFGMKHAIPVMRAQGGGSIISTASIAGLQNGFGPILYSVAKASIVHMTKVAAAQLGPMNIRVNCICPGLIATPIFAKGVGLATQVADQTVTAIQGVMKNSQPIPRAGLPSDIAEAALFLASDGSGFVNGHALVVDGGITVGPTGAAQEQVYAPFMQAMGIDPAILVQMTAPGLGYEQ
jgi:NAD(P)-dependent dehydrogenase (short-subunit alcohol dehydrogenase family)